MRIHFVRGSKNLHAKRLIDILANHIGRQLGYRYHIDVKVVLCGSADPSGLQPDEQLHTWTLDKFLAIANLDVYKKTFLQFSENPWLKNKRPNDETQLQIFEKFFKGSNVKPKTFVHQNYRIEGSAIFDHPRNIYSEFETLHVEDENYRALLRRWDFSPFGEAAMTQTDRAKIGLREQRVHGQIRALREDILDRVLRPIVPLSESDVTDDLCELYELRKSFVRLDDYLAQKEVSFSPRDRLELARSLLSAVAALHSIRIGHRDLSTSCVWVGKDDKSIRISRLNNAYFEDMGTVGPLREQIMVGASRLPEDVDPQKIPSDPFRRDVFLLAGLSHRILFGHDPDKSDGVMVWTQPSCDPEIVSVCPAIARGLSQNPQDRFKDAAAFLVEFNACSNDAAISEQVNESVVLDKLKSFVKTVTPLLDFPPRGTYEKGSNRISYHTEINGIKAVVKVWTTAGMRTGYVRDNRHLLEFLNRCDRAATCGSPIPEMLNYGLSDSGGLFIVTKFIDGSSWTECLHSEQQGDDILRAKMCAELVRQVIKLHDMGLWHGDLQPQNVILREDQVASEIDGVARSKDMVKVWLIDALDFDAHGIRRNETYSPPNHDHLTFEACDRYATVKMVSEALAKAVQPGVVSAVREAKKLLKEDSEVRSLKSLLSALEQVLDATSAANWWTVHVNGLAPEFLADDGQYHIRVQKPADSRQIQYRITGAKLCLFVAVDRTTRRTTRLTLEQINYATLINDTRRRSFVIKGQISLVNRSVPDAWALTEYIINIHERQENANVAGISEPQGLDGQLSYSPSIGLNTRQLWSSFIKYELDALPAVTVASQPEIRGGVLHIPFAETRDVFDFEDQDEIYVLKGDNVVGMLDTTRTTTKTLVIRDIKWKANLAEGDELKLQSMRDRISFNRRAAAVERIVEGRSVIPNLVDYFNITSVPSKQYTSLENDQSLDRYTFRTDSGNVTYQLSPQQRIAFKTVLEGGPVSLLQGPPGTGKTSFIAAFIHFVLHEGRANNVLLVSQSHHAVNNVVESVRWLFNALADNASLVRFGQEGMLSEATLDVHPSALLRAWFSRFEDEFENRLCVLAPCLALPEPFVREASSVFRDLGYLLTELDRAERPFSVERGSGHVNDNQQLQAKAHGLSGAIEAKVHSLGVNVSELKSAQTVRERWQIVARAIAEKHDVDNKKRIDTLSSVLFLTLDWLEQLRTGRGNFDEFLVRTKKIVAGTCVGIGQGHLQIYDRVFDWVIVDEAARATSGELAVAIQSAKRVLLVGDHKQLPPMIPEETIDHVRGAMAIVRKEDLMKSDFERAFDASGAVRATLTEQYRMVDAIGNLVSSCFYENKLITKRSESPEWMGGLKEPFNVSVTWLDTHSAGALALERQQSDGHSYYNSYEVECVVSLLKTIADDDGAMQGIASLATKWVPIGVVTTYELQRARLVQSLAQQDWFESMSKYVKIDTVDSYQGQENPIIIVSLVRNNRDGKIGFTGAEERINVALSRARDKLVIIGSKSFFTRSNLERRPLGRVAKFIESAVDKKNYAIVAAQKFVRGG